MSLSSPLDGPRRQRASRPQTAPPRALPQSQEPSSELRLRLALALCVISALSALFNLLAVLALGRAIAHLGAPQGPLEFAVVFIGAVLGLGGDVLILRGALPVVMPQGRFSGRSALVTWGLVLELVAAGAVGLLASSFFFAAVYVLLLAGLAWLWTRSSPPTEPRPQARHPEPEPGPTTPRDGGEPLERQPIPWIGSAPPPPSAPPLPSSEPFRPGPGPRS